MRSALSAAATATAAAVAAAVVAAAAVVSPVAASTRGAASPAGLGSFASWRAAQRAAGFRLLKPSVTFGQRRNGDIAVTKCLVKHQFTKRVVIANYGRTVRAQLSVNQNNSGKPCLRTTRMTRLATVTVHGATATLSGLCGRTGFPSCTSRRIWLYLVWSSHHVYYVTSSFGERRATLISFARGLVRVG
jgi:hypothetical protein